MEPTEVKTISDGTSAAEIIASSLSGGLLSSLSGGDFANGAITGAYSMMFNEMMHPMISGLSRKLIKSAKMGNLKDLRIIQHEIESDGKLDFSEARLWYHIGQGRNLTVDASSLNLNFLDVSEFEIGKSRSFSTLLGGIHQFLVYGSITAIYQGNNLFQILNDTYNFEMHEWSSAYECVRNIETLFGRFINGKGQRFDIIFRGLNRIR